MKLFDLTGRKAIVTSATRGLGRGMAEGLMEAGCEVVVVGSSASAPERGGGVPEQGLCLPRVGGGPERAGAEKGGLCPGGGAAGRSPGHPGEWGRHPAPPFL